MSINNLDRMLNQLIANRGCTKRDFALAAGIPPSALNNISAGMAPRAHTMKQLFESPMLQTGEALKLAMAWLQDRRNELGFESDKIVVKKAGKDPVNHDDPALMAMIAGLVELAKKNTKVYEALQCLHSLLSAEPDN